MLLTLKAWSYEGDQSSVTVFPTPKHIIKQQKTLLRKDTWYLQK